MPAADRSTALPDRLLAAASAALACPRPLTGVWGDLRRAPGRSGTAEGSGGELPQLFTGWKGAQRGPVLRIPTSCSQGFCSPASNDSPLKRVARRNESRVHYWRHWRPLSGTQTKACRPACAHALPRRTGPACPVTFSKFTCIPERSGGRSGPGHSERAWPSGGLGTQRPRVRAGPQCGPLGCGEDRRASGHCGPLVFGSKCSGCLAQTRRAPGAC